MSTYYNYPPGFSSGDLADRLDADLGRYRSLGWNVLPVHGKRSLLPWKDGPPSATSIRGVIASGSATGLAVLLGGPSGGLVCRDFDDLSAFREWERLHPTLARELPIARTPRPGRHVYARIAGPIGTRAYPDGELRADGGYVVAPFSVHASGGFYEWSREPGDRIPEVDPGDLLLPGQKLGPEAAASPPEPPPNECVPSDRSSLIGRCADGVDERLTPAREFDLDGFVEAAIAATLPSGPGQRNNCLFDFSRYLRRAFPVDTPHEDLEPIVRAWHARALPFIRTKGWQATWGDFTRSWGYRWGEAGFLRAVAAGAAVDRYSLGRNGNEDAVARVFRSAHLQAGETAFYLAVRHVGEAVGIGTMTAQRWATSLIDRGYLLKIERGRWAKARRDRRANVWSWLGDAA